MNKLMRGDRLAVVSPASTPRPELVECGMERLRELGYEPVLFPHALARGPLYYAGTAQQRADDLHAAFADQSIAAVICTRGGWGSAELLPLLDAKLIGKNAKPFIGYSDHTSLHCWMQNKIGMPTFYAPMVAADFARENGVDTASWQSALCGDAAWVLGAAEGLRVLRSGKARGRLRGGCISILAASLGTPYAARVDEDSILFLEDVGTKPYQWDRMLLHLKYAGLLKKVRGIVFGDMKKCVEDAAEEDLLQSALLHALEDFKGPIAIGLRCGHVEGANVSLPLGVKTELDLSEGVAEMRFVS